MINKSLLMTKGDIPFQEGRLIIHQPSYKEISFIGEKAFFAGCEYLTFSKEKINSEDKIRLKSINDFDILMMIINDKQDINMEKIKVYMQLVLLLLFPDYKVNFLPNSIMLFRKEQDNIEQKFINKQNFESFKNIVSKMFCLNVINAGSASAKYNPGGPQARALVKKFQERQKKLAKLRNQGKEKQVSILADYISILAVGEQKDINLLSEYSVYQLFNEFQRFRNRQAYNLYIQFKCAGAKDLDNVENWMGEITLDSL